MQTKQKFLKVIYLTLSRTAAFYMEFLDASTEQKFLLNHAQSLSSNFGIIW